MLLITKKIRTCFFQILWILLNLCSSSLQIEPALPKDAGSKLPSHALQVTTYFLGRNCCRRQISYEVARVLKPGGVYLLTDYRDPERVQELFEREEWESGSLT